MPPLSLMIKPVSSLCNMHCRYCFYRDVAAHREAASYGKMTDETMEALIRKAFIYADGSVSFAFQGGEPTLAGLDFFRRFTALVRRYNTLGVQATFAIQTNGLVIDDAFAAFFREENFLVGLSLDGGRETHDALRPDAQDLGTYDRTLAAADILRRHEVPFNILCVVTEPIARRPRETFEALAPYGFIQYIPCLDGFDRARDAYSLTPERYGAFLCETFDLYVRAWRRGKPVSIRDFDNYLQMVAGYPPEHCGLGGTCGRYILLEADGSAFPCDFYVLDEWKLGNIREHSFARLMRSPIGDAFISRSHTLDPACEACQWRALCRGGCRREREPFTGEVPSRHRLCEAYRTFFAHAQAPMADMAKEVFARQKGGAFAPPRL